MRHAHTPTSARAQARTVAVLSDIHYASAAEQARGSDYEYRLIANPALRLALRLHRRYVWLRDPLNKNHLLDRFLEQTAGCDFAVANGDYSCNTAFVGVSDPAAGRSARECLGRLRTQFKDRFRATFGDHELGKVSFVGGHGGMRLASWHCALEHLALEPLWRLEIGNYLLLGVVSSLVALPAFEADTLPAERPELHELRQEHLAAIRRSFTSLAPTRKVLLFCHDPTALPFLLAEAEVRNRLDQIEQTIIGHLHSRLILWQAQLLAGIPRITFLGHTARRLSLGLSQARLWRPFKVRLCPSLAGIELLKDGGYYLIHLDPAGAEPARFQFCPIRR